MKNFNPMFSSMNMMRSASPFATAGASFASRSISPSIFTKTAGSKITLSGILNGAQKTIGTVNQIVPLYNQIKPMFQNSKILLNVAKSIRGTPRFSRRNNLATNNSSQPETIEVAPQESNQPPQQTTYKREEGPSKPYFA